jgi:hypothetical protein
MLIYLLADKSEIKLAQPGVIMFRKNSSKLKLKLKYFLIVKVILYFQIKIPFWIPTDLNQIEIIIFAFF